MSFTKKIIIILLICLASKYTVKASNRTVRILNKKFKPIPMDYEEIRRINELKRQEEFHRHLQESITDEELLRISEEMFNADDNNAFKQIRVDIQGNTTSYSRVDVAPNNLLTVPESVLSGPTIAPFVALFDNYCLDWICPETETTKELRQQNTYINAILATRPMNILMNFLVNKGVTHLRERQGQLYFIKKIWFTKFGRHWVNIIKYSCAFEYTFMSEAIRCDDRGLHNWVYFAKRETTETLRANYLGYINKLDLPGKGMILKHTAIMGAKNRLAPSIIMFVGTSPELETALYTLCFMARPNATCNLRCNDVPFTVTIETRMEDNERLVDKATPNL